MKTTSLQIADSLQAPPLIRDVPGKHPPAARKLAGDTIWLAIDQFTRLGLGFLFNAWLARQLSIEHFAAFALAQATAIFVKQFTTAGMDGVLTQELVLRPHENGRLLGTAASLRAIFASLTCVAVIAYFWAFSGMSHHQVQLIAIGCVFNILTFSEVFDNQFQANLRAGVSARIRLLSWAVAATASGAMLYNGASLLSFYTLLCCSSLLNGVIAWRTSRRRYPDVKLSYSREAARELLSLSWPLLLSAIFLALYSRFGQVMLGLLSTPVEVATFAISSQLVDAWRVLPLLVVTSVFPYLIKIKKTSVAQFEKNLTTAFSAFFWCSVIVVLSYCLLIDVAIGFFFGEKYASASTVTKIQVATVPFAAWATLVSRVIIVEKALSFSIYRHLAGAFVGITAGLLLIPRHGANGAAIATSLAFFMAGYGALFFDPRMRRYGIMMTRSPLAIGGICDLAKKITGRPSSKSEPSR